MTTKQPTFNYEALPMRVVFGAGSLAQIPQEAEQLGLRRLLVLSTPQQEQLADQAETLLGKACVGRFTEARMHVPADVAADAVKAARETGADGCLAIGGGSTIGLGKAIALETGLPVISVPTTYAGSEMTPIWGLTEHGRKRTGRDRTVLPRSVIYDPELTLGLPVGLSVTSGFNAIAHAVEALYAPDASPIISLMAEEGVRSLATALPTIAEHPWTLGRGRTHCGGPGCAAPAWGPPRCRCTTSSATSSAVPSTCPTPKPTRSCSRTSPPSTSRRHRRPNRR